MGRAASQADAAARLEGEAKKRAARVCRSRMANGLKIFECPILASYGRVWVALPAKPQLDADGNPRRGAAGKVQYTRLLAWRDKAQQDAFSERVIELVRGAPDPLAGQ